MQFNRLIGLLLAILVLAIILIPAQPNVGTATSIPQDEDQVANVVDKYVAWARAGSFKDLSSITTEVPESAYRKKIEAPSPSPARQSNRKKLKDVVAVELVPTRSNLKYREMWLLERFPKGIFDNQTRIALVRNINVKGDFARVVVHLQAANEADYRLLPWCFMLTKKPDGKWTIYDVVTPSVASDYYP